MEVARAAREQDVLRRRPHKPTLKTVTGGDRHINGVSLTSEGSWMCVPGWDELAEDRDVRERCVPGWDEKAKGHGCPVAAVA